MTIALTRTAKEHLGLDSTTRGNHCNCLPSEMHLIFGNSVLRQRSQNLNISKCTGESSGQSHTHWQVLPGCTDPCDSGCFAEAIEMTGFVNKNSAYL